MLEPANQPDDPETERIAFMRRFGGLLAEGVIRLSLGGMAVLEDPQVRLERLVFDLPVDPGGTVALVIRLGLLEPRPMEDGQLRTEAALVDLGDLQIVTVPGEITPEVGRAIRARLPGPHTLLITLGLDHLGYMISDRQWAEPAFHYERSMSLGPETTGRVLAALDALLARSHQEWARAQPVRDLQPLAVGEPPREAAAPPEPDRSAEPIIGMGSMRPEDIRTVIRDHSPDLQACWQGHLAPSPALATRTMVGFTIGADGRVADAGIELAGLGDAGLQACLRKVIRGFVFPKPLGGGIVEVRYPIVFQAGG
jgi:hypothetical protein